MTTVAGSRKRLKRRKHANTTAHARAAGRLGGLVGGKARTPAKQAAARANGAKGGRPPKLKPRGPFEISGLWLVDAVPSGAK